MMSMTKMEVLVDLNSSQQKIIKFSPSSCDNAYNKLVSEYDADFPSRNGKWISLESDSFGNESYEELVVDPGYGVKGTVEDGTRVIINVCKCEKIRKPSLEKQIGSDGRTNVIWNIPHCFAASEDYKANSVKVKKIFNLVVHPDTYRMAETNSGFYKMVNDIAINELHEKFATKVSNNLLEIITKKREQQHLTSDKAACSDDQGGERITKHNINSTELSVDNSRKPKKVSSKKSKKGKFQTPDYRIYSYPKAEIELGEEAKNYRTNQLVIEVDLPLLDSITPISVNIRDQKLLIVTRDPTQYKLEIDLPDAINKSGKQVHFDKRTKQLKVSLPILEDQAVECSIDGYLHTFARNNSGGGIVAGPQKDDDLNNAGKSVVGLTDDESGAPASCEELMQVSAPVCHSIQETGIVSCMPEFSCHMESMVLSFVFHVKGVQEELTSFKVVSPHSCQLKMSSLDALSGAAVHFSCCLKFHEGCTLCAASCSVSVSDQNVVLLLSKDPESCGNWDYYLAGTTFDCMENHEFVTSSTLTRDLDRLDTECQQLASANEEMKQSSQGPSLQVTNMDENKLTVVIQHLGKPTVMESHEASEVSDIVVVHTKSCPRLHSILKQRTISESSDDGRRLSFSADRLISTASEDASESEDGGFDSHLSSSVSSGSSMRPVLKKSVSFNDRIDHAVFQVNQSVSAMHAILKNRRRRARKRDQYLQHKAEATSGTRRRCRSSGSISMEDSGDEHHLVVLGKVGLRGKMSDLLSASEVKTKGCSTTKDVKVSQKSNSLSDFDDEQQEDFNDAVGKSQVMSEVECPVDAAKEKNLDNGIARHGTSKSVEFFVNLPERAPSHCYTVQQEATAINSNDTGVGSVKLTQSGRNVVNSEGSFRTNMPNGFYQGDYEMLSEIGSSGCKEPSILFEGRSLGSCVEAANESALLDSADGGCLN